MTFKDYFMLQYGSEKDIDRILGSSEYDSNPRANQSKNDDIDNFHEVAFQNPMSTREHAMGVLKNHYNFGKRTLTSASRHPDLTRDDIAKVVGPWSERYKKSRYSVPAYIEYLHYRLESGLHK